MVDHSAEGAAGPSGTGMRATGGGGGALRRVSTGGPWEDAVGYSRAVVAGPFVFVAGCTSMLDGAVQHEGDPFSQTLSAFDIVARALGEVGASLADVVQTRLYVVHISDQEDVGRAHRQLFADVRPAATMVAVAGLVDSRMLVEVEAVAYVPEPLAAP